MEGAQHRLESLVRRGAGNERKRGAVHVGPKGLDFIPSATGSQSSHLNFTLRVHLAAAGSMEIGQSANTVI